MDQPEAPEKARTNSHNHLDATLTKSEKKPAHSIALKLRKALRTLRWCQRLRFPSRSRKPNFKSRTVSDGGSAPSEVETPLQFEPPSDRHPSESNPDISSLDVLYGSTSTISTDTDSTRSGSITHQDASSSRTNIAHVSPSNAVPNDTASIATSISAETITYTFHSGSSPNLSIASSERWLDDGAPWTAGDRGPGVPSSWNYWHDA